VADEELFGRWLRARRKALDLTQNDLAHHIGCSVVAIRKFEAGERRPSKQIAERLAVYLAIPPEEHAAFIRFARGRSTPNPPLGSEQRATLDPWRALSVHPTNLSVPPARLIGREQAVAAVRDYLLRDEVRLLTLLGAPGIGKSCLGLQAAASLVEQFRDGAFFVELGSTEDPDLVATTMAQTLGVVSAGNQPPSAGLAQFLKNKQMLLLLDNFEHVVAAAPLLTDLLAACPGLKVLVTSRAALHMQNEWHYSVSPLALPDLARLPDVETLSHYSAVALFVQYARVVRPDFTLTSANAHAVAAICTRLDGLPLAIKLAAAHSRLLSPPDLLKRLMDGPALLQMLADGPRDLPARQQSLRDAIDRSYNLLGPEEQKLCRRLAVFAGGFSLAAAEAVTSATHDLSANIIRGVEALIDQSLLQSQKPEAGEPRFEMLVTIRESALERLKLSGELARIQRRHGGYYLRLAETAEPCLSGEEQTLWLNRLERDHDNLRAALRWALDRRGMRIALRLCVALDRFWLLQGHQSERRKWLELVLTASSRAQGRSRARTPYDFTQATALLEKSLAIQYELDDKPGMAGAAAPIHETDTPLRSAPPTAITRPIRIALPTATTRPVQKMAKRQHSWRLWGLSLLVSLGLLGGAGLISAVLFGGVTIPTSIPPSTIPNTSGQPTLVPTQIALASPARLVAATNPSASPSPTAMPMVFSSPSPGLKRTAASTIPPTVTNPPSPTPPPSLTPTPAPSQAPALTQALALTQAPTKTPFTFPPVPSHTPPPSHTPISTAVPPSPTAIATDTATPPRPPTPSCAITSGGLTLSGAYISWSVQNNGATPVVLSNLEVGWPDVPDSQRLHEVSWRGGTIAEGNDDQPPSLLPGEMNWLGTPADRELGLNASTELQIEFQDPLLPNGYSVTLTFDNGCTVTANN